MITQDKSGPFDNCAAIAFAGDAQGSGVLTALARQIGFADVADVAHFASLPQQALPFYFIHGDLPEQTKLRLIKSIRSAKEARRRYAPIVCVLMTGPRHLIVDLVGMGFDEVLFAHDPVSAMAQKLAGQIGQKLTYVETSTYLGPDRRRIELIDRRDPRRRGDTHFRKIAVLRDPLNGISASYMR